MKNIKIIIKSFQRVLTVLAFVVGISGSLLCIVYWDGVKVAFENFNRDHTLKMKTSAIARYGFNLPEVDEVRIKSLVDQEPPKHLGKYDFNHPKPLFVVNEKVLVGDEAREVANLWRKLDFGGLSSGCFEPHHVVQFRHKGDNLCESVVCFICENLTLPSFPSPVLVGFEAQSNDAKANLTSFKKIINSK